MAMKTKAQAAVLKDFNDGMENCRRSILWSGFDKKLELSFGDAIEHLESRFNKLFDSHCKMVNASSASSSESGEGS